MGEKSVLQAGFSLPEIESLQVRKEPSAVLGMLFCYFVKDNVER